MSESEGQRPKKRDAQRTRAAILDAAEAVFAQHGFDGARIDAIANASGYNNGLLFRYFGDKLGLYTEVLRRTDSEMGTLLARVFTPLLEDETIVSDAQQWRDFLSTTFGAFFDYMVEHPHAMRIFNWEQAAGWQTFMQVATKFEPDDLTKLESVFARAREAGLIRRDLDVVVMVMLVEQICWSSPATLPLYQSLLASRNFSTTAALAHVRKQTIAFLVAGVISDMSDEPKEERK